MENSERKKDRRRGKRSGGMRRGRRSDHHREDGRKDLACCQDAMNLDFYLNRKDEG